VGWVVAFGGEFDGCGGVGVAIGAGSADTLWKMLE
jgi:hypothetical protein